MNSKHVFYFRLWHTTFGSNRDSVPPSSFRKAPGVAGRSMKTTLSLFYPIPPRFLILSCLHHQCHAQRVNKKENAYSYSSVKGYNTFLDVIVNENGKRANELHHLEHNKCLRNKIKTSALSISHIAVVVCILFLMYQSKKKNIVIKPVY